MVLISKCQAEVNWGNTSRTGALDFVCSLQWCFCAYKTYKPLKHLKTMIKQQAPVPRPHYTWETHHVAISFVRFFFRCHVTFTEEKQKLEHIPIILVGWYAAWWNKQHAKQCHDNMHQAKVFLPKLMPAKPDRERTCKNLAMANWVPWKAPLS